MNTAYLSDTLKENGLSEDTLCRVVIVRLNVRYNPNNLFMIQSAITQAFAQMNCSFYRYNYPNEYILIIEKERQHGHGRSGIVWLTGYNPRKFTDAVVLYSAVRLEDIPES